MTDKRNAALQFAQERRQDFLAELREFCSIPSVSTDPGYKADMQRAAEWMAGKLRTLGTENVQVFQTEGHPVVYGESLTAGPAAPTALVYGHYDVQPAEPLDLWQSGPFEATVRGENIFARGITDMKGQILAFTSAMESIIEQGTLPVNLKFMIEGEEEIGSPSLPRFMQEHKDLLACDFAINPDTGILAADSPSITYGLRGLAYFEIRVYGPDHDLHSGIFGGIVHNPAQALCELLAGMHNAQGQITLPGFYDSVRSLEAEERADLASLPVSDQTYLEQTGAPALFGEAGYTNVERIGARPTLEINGFYSGYTGPGTKTVLPAQAMAKVSMRLVPDQDPQEVHAQLLRYLELHAPQTIRWEVNSSTGSPASISDRKSRYVQALSTAIESVWGKRPVFKREGGSVPVVTQFKEILGVETVNTGFSLPNDNAHSPNEKMHFPTWERGIDAFIHYLYNLGEQK